MSNLVTNPSFETPGLYGRPDGWYFDKDDVDPVNSVAPIWDGTVARTGTQSVKFEAIPGIFPYSVARAGILAHDRITVSPGTLYYLSLWVKKNNIQAPAGYSVPYLIVDERNASGVVTVWKPYYLVGEGTLDWNQHLFVHTTQSTTGSLGIGVKQVCWGTMWVDDVSVDTVPPAGCAPLTLATGLQIG